MSTIDYRMPDPRDIVAVERAARRLRSETLVALVVAGYRKTGALIARLGGARSVGRGGARGVGRGAARAA
jgi:hypothetical protein